MLCKNFFRKYVFVIFLLPVGKTQVLPIKPLQSIHASDGKIIKLREAFGKILVTGVKIGEATITTPKTSLEVYVLKESDVRSYNILSEKIKKMLGLKIQIQNSKIYVSGRLLRLSDWEKLALISQQESLRWVLKAQIDSAIQSQILKQTKNILEESNLPIPSLKVTPLLEARISKTNAQHSERFAEVLSSLGYQIVEDSKAIEIEPMVDLKVQMVELKKSSFHKLGIDLPQSYKAQILPASNFKVVGQPFEIALNALEQDGSARIIAEPHLSCRSGKEAKFLAGGEFPIKIVNFETHDIQWKKHGILLDFKPLADRSGQMSLSLSAEVSMLDQAQTVDGIPGILVNRVESHLDLKNSQTVALSGLIKQHTGTSNQGLYGLKDIPVIGSLFSSEDYREERTDLVVFVTPKVLTGGAM